MANVFEKLKNDSQSNQINNQTKSSFEIIDKLTDTLNNDLQEEIQNLEKQNTKEQVINNQDDNLEPQPVQNANEDLANVNQINNQNETILKELQELKLQISNNDIFAQINNRLDQIEAVINNSNDNKSDIDEVKNLELKNNNLLNKYISQNCEFEDKVQRRMFSEMQDLQKKVSRDFMNTPLAEIAEIYGQYFHLAEDNIEIDEKSVKKYQNQVSYLLDSLADFLEEEGCEVYRSKEGAQYRARYSKIKTPVTPTGEKSLHRQVIKSLNPGVSKDNRVLYAEYVNVYSYDENLDIKENNSQSEEIKEELLSKENETILESETTDKNEIIENTQSESNKEEI